MTVKETKEYLLSVRRAKREVKRYQALKQQARDLACSATAPTDKLAVSGGKGGDLFVCYAQYSAALDERIAELFDLQSEVTRTIARVQDSRYRELLLGYYVEGMTWEQVACQMDYCYMQVCRLHGQALEAMKDIM